MPYVRIEINAQLTDECKSSVIELLTQQVHDIKNVSSEAVSVCILDNLSLGFSGDCKTPAAAVHFYNAIMPAEFTQPMTAAIANVLQEHCQLPPQRLYTFYHQTTETYLVGWGGATFDQIRDSSDWAHMVGKPMPLSSLAKGRLLQVNKDGKSKPLADQTVQLWNVVNSLESYYLGSAQSNEDGRFTLYYTRRDGGAVDIWNLELKVYGKPTEIVIEDNTVPARNLLGVFANPEVVSDSTADFADITVKEVKPD